MTGSDTTGDIGVCGAWQAALLQPGSDRGSDHGSLCLVRNQEKCSTRQRAQPCHPAKRKAKLQATELHPSGRRLGPLIITQATPIVAGAAALTLAAAGGGGAISPAALKQLLMDSVDSIPGLSGKVVTGVSLRCLCASTLYVVGWACRLLLAAWQAAVLLLHKQAKASAPKVCPPAMHAPMHAV